MLLAMDRMKELRRAVGSFSVAGMRSQNNCEQNESYARGKNEAVKVCIFSYWKIKYDAV